MLGKQGWSQQWVARQTGQGVEQTIKTESGKDSRGMASDSGSSLGFSSPAALESWSQDHFKVGQIRC